MTCVLAPLVGRTPFNLPGSSSRRCRLRTSTRRFFIARLPRAVAGALVGGALASAGVVFQGLLRNPLATPYTLGVSAGASLGAMLGHHLRGHDCRLARGRPSPVASRPARPSQPRSSMRWPTCPRRAMSTTVLLLAGVTLNSFFSALILFVQYPADFAEVLSRHPVADGRPRRRRLRPDRRVPAARSSRAVAIFAVLPSSLNLLGVDADSASARGVDVAAAQRWAFVSASMASERGGDAGRADRVRRRRRAAPGPPAGGRRPPHRPAGVGAGGRRVPGGVRPGRAHHPRPGGNAGRRGHRPSSEGRSFYGCWSAKN